MKRAQRDIVEFYKKFGIEFPKTPKALSEDHMSKRLAFLEEELEETRAAYLSLCQAEKPTDEHLSEVIDGLIDLIYVAVGTLVLMGVCPSAHWRVVHNCNMQKVKVKDRSQSKRDYDQDLVKPEGWKPPDHVEIIEVFRNSYRLTGKGALDE